MGHATSGQEGLGRLANALTRLAASPVNYGAGFVIDAAVAGWIVVHALRSTHETLATDSLIVLAGFGLYGLLEYLVHRWGYHDRRSPATAGHQLHHEDPEALIGLPFFMPATVVVALWALVRRLLGEGDASLLMAAVAINFLYYGTVHHSLHHWRFKARCFRTLRSHHLIHHHFPDRNFGVTMTLWDWVFGTHYLSARVSRAADEGGAGVDRRGADSPV